MRQHLDKFQKLPISSQLSLLVAAVLLFTIGITINNALTRQEKRTHAASSNPSAYNTPVPSCSPRPACLDADPKCLIPEPSTGWCKDKSTLGESSSRIAQQIYITPTIYCLGSCPTLPVTQIPTQILLTPIPTNTPISPTQPIPTTPVTQIPNTSPTPSLKPCVTSATAATANSTSDEESSHKNNKKKTNGLLQQLLDLIKWLIDLLLRLLGLGGAPIPIPTPIVEPTLPISPTLSVEPSQSITPEPSPTDEPCEPLPTPTQIPNPTPTICTEKSFKYKVTNEGGSAKVSDSTGKSVYSNSDHSVAIQWALDNLTKGRTTKEKVWIVGDFMINNTIIMPSYVTWVLEGKIILGNHVDKILIADSSSGAADIDMSGGIYDGNKANQLVSAAADHVIKFTKVTKSRFRDMIMQNAVNDNFTLDTLSNNNVVERLVGRWAGTAYTGPGATNDGNGLDDKGDHNTWIDCIAEDNYSDNWVIKSRDSTFIRAIGRGSKNAVGFGPFADRNITGNKFYDIKAYNNIHAGFAINIPPKSDGKGYVVQSNYIQGEFYNNGTNGIRFKDSTKDGSIKNNTIDIWTHNNGAVGFWIEDSRVNNNSGSVIAYDNKTSDLTLLGTNTFTVYHPKDKAAPKINKGSSKVNLIDFTCPFSNIGTWAVNKYCGNIIQTFIPTSIPTVVPNSCVSPTLSGSSTPTPTSKPISVAPTSAGVLPTIPTSPAAGPISRPLPATCTHIVYNQSGKVSGRNTASGSIVSGTLNQVLSSIGKSGNHVCIQNGNYLLSEITDLQPNVILECESNAVIKGVAPSGASYLIHLKSGSTVKNCTFDHHGKTIFASGEVRNWRVENNYFINSVIAVLVENLTTNVKKLVDIPNNFPTSGWGVIKDNKGLHSKLATFEGTTNLTVTGNYFTDLNGSEFVDFNYNVHNVIFDSNTFINNSGYSLSQEVIDMIGGNNYQTDYNTVSNNMIIGNFQTAIRPAKSASHNTITNNYIEYKPGKAANIAGIYFYGAGTTFSTPKDNKVTNNTIIGAPIGIELSGSDNNKVTGNKISNAVKGISLVKTSTSTYGASVSPKNNTVSNNTITNADYGIYSVSSPSNTISGNTITSFKIKATQILP